jgi:hypothetical protein
MPINLNEIPAAVKAYLDTKVTVTVSSLIPAAGGSINPNEDFSFNVTVTNANAAAGGIALRNVKYRLSVDSAAVGKLRVPSIGSSTDLAGAPLVAGAEVAAFIYTPPAFVIFGDTAAYLSVGDVDTQSFSGKAGSGAAGGTTTIRARILADVDLDQLFPKGEDTAIAMRTLSVVG